MRMRHSIGVEVEEANRGGKMLKWRREDAQGVQVGFARESAELQRK
jgi:hypothetical protein